MSDRPVQDSKELKWPTRCPFFPSQCGRGCSGPRISSPRQRIPKHIAGDRSFVFEADAHALRKRLPPKQVLVGLTLVDERLSDYVGLPKDHHASKVYSGRGSRQLCNQVPICPKSTLSVVSRANRGTSSSSKAYWRVSLPRSGRKESPSMLLTKWTTSFGFAVALTACMAPAASPQSTPMSGNAERIRQIEENTAVIPQGENKPLIRLWI